MIASDNPFLRREGYTGPLKGRRMYHASRKWCTEEPSPAYEQRQHPRLTMRCPARVRIGCRHYAAYLENISEGGAKVRTLSPLIPAEKVILLLPDLPPIRGKLQWTKPNEGGIAFQLPRGLLSLRGWMTTRSPKQTDAPK